MNERSARTSRRLRLAELPIGHTCKPTTLTCLDLAPKPSLSQKKFSASKAGLAGGEGAAVGGRDWQVGVLGVLSQHGSSNHGAQNLDWQCPASRASRHGVHFISLLGDCEAVGDPGQARQIAVRREADSEELRRCTDIVSPAPHKLLILQIEAPRY